MKTNTQTENPRAENLDGFLDPADLNAHISEVVTAGDYCPQYIKYATRKARAMDCRLMGLIEEARTHEFACDTLYPSISDAWRVW